MAGRKIKTSVKNGVEDVMNVENSGEVVVTNPNEEVMEYITSEITADEGVDTETKDDEAIPEVTADPSLVEDSKESTEQKKVRIRLKRNYHCNIGGTFYVFNGGQCYNVEENVKMILARADVLDVL